MSERSEVQCTTYTIGQHVRMRWTGGTRDGVVVGEEFADSLPTGARFVPVEWADGSRDNVDTRVLSISTGSFAECPDCAGHLYLTTVTLPNRLPHGGYIAEAAWECDEPCEHGPLADRDVYVEHDEVHDGVPDETGRVALYIVRTDEREPFAPLVVQSSYDHQFRGNEDGCEECLACGAVYHLSDRGDGVGVYTTASGHEPALCTDDDGNMSHGYPGERECRECWPMEGCEHVTHDCPCLACDS